MHCRERFQGRGATVDDCRLLQTEPLEAFSIRLKIAGYGGIALAMPVLLWQLWRFVSPGLYAKEKKYAIPFVLSSSKHMGGPQGAFRQAQGESRMNPLVDGRAPWPQGILFAIPTARL